MKTIRKATVNWKRVQLVKEEGEASIYGKKVTSSQEVYNTIHSLLENEVTEVFIVLFLNTKNKITGYQEVSRGGLNSTVIKPRDVFRAAIMTAVPSIVIAHNHPSGDPAPSQTDIDFTHGLCRAGELLGVQVLDHIVVGEDNHFSFVDAHLMGE